MPISYDYEDFGLSEQSLRNKYPSGHPEYTIEEWGSVSVDREDFSGYWDWVHQMIELDDESIPSN